MTKAILSEAIVSQLPLLDGQVELCNEEGQTLGFFLPPELHRKYMYAWAKAQVSDQEVEQARHEIRENGGLTTGEALAHLQSVIDSHEAG